MKSVMRLCGICICIGFLLLNTIGYTQITPPESYLGFVPGADYKLMTYEQAIGYCELLASQSGRIKVFDMGPTSMGRRMKYLLITSEANMARIERYKEISRRLSVVRGVSPEEAERLSDEGKAVVWIDGGLHASEVAPAQHIVQLAYDLITREDPKTKSVRDNVIALLVFANPDGMTLVGDWYMKYLGTQYENSSMPWLYHKYIGHDNNRDSFNVTQLETQNISRVQYKEWSIQVLLNHHQTAPFPTRIFIPPAGEPVNPNQHPLVIRWENLFGAAMGKSFDEENKPGAISRIAFDKWYPGYVTLIVTSHNVPSLLTEVALYRMAAPHEYTVNEIPAAYRDFMKSVFYPNPWKGGWWRLRDAVEYTLTASRSVLETAALYRRELLLNKYKMGADVIAQFNTEYPYGWIIDTPQNDPNTAALLLNRMILLGTEVYQAERDFSLGGKTISKGTYIIPASQPYGYFAKTMFEVQNYPDLWKYPDAWQALVSRITADQKQPLRPYDVTGWTLPIQYGVKYSELPAPVPNNTPVAIVTAVEPVGDVIGTGNYYYFDHRDNNSFIALNKLLSNSATVGWATAPFTDGGSNYPAGTFIINGKSIARKDLETIAKDAHITVTSGATSPAVTKLAPLHLGIYQSWTANLDEGWLRWLYEQYAFPYTSLHDADIRAGNLKEKYDAIVLPEQSAQSITSGNRPQNTPPEYAGGITDAGAENIKKFVEAGGTLICFSQSGALAIRIMNLPVTNSMQEIGRGELYCPGTILKMDYNINHPVAYGMERHGCAFYTGSTLYELQNSTPVSAGRTSAIIASFPNDSLLISGWIQGDNKIRGKSAALDIPFGNGRVIMFNFSVHNRAQMMSTVKLLFNAVYYR